MPHAATADEDLPERDDPAGGESERDAIVRAIGPKVRQLRQAGGMSLQQLARRAEVSAAAIHKVERGDMVPTVTTLLKLAAALGRPMGHFVDGGEPTPVAHLVRADQRLAAPSVPGTALAVLSGPPERFALRGRAVVVEAGAEFTPDRHGGENLLVLLDGELEVTVSDERYALGAGDALQFPADHPVRLHNAAPAPARALWVSGRG